MDGTSKAAPRAEASAPPARAPANGAASFLSDVGDVLGAVTVDAFLDALGARLEEMVRAETADTPYAGRPCPWIPYLLGRYRGRPAVEVARAIRLYLGGRQPETATDTIGALAEVGRREVRQWLASGGPPPPVPTAPVAALSDGRGDPADAGAVWTLGPGAPLPSHVLARMEGALGSDLSRVRMHDHGAAHALAGAAHAHAFAVGNEIGFAQSRFQPGTVTGDAILAHELAHTVQFARGASATGETAAMERGADLAAARAVGRLHAPGSVGRIEALVARAMPTPARGGGLSLKRCGGPPDVAPTEWREEGRAERDDLARQIKEKHDEIQSILAHPVLSDADFARMNVLYVQIQDLVAKLRTLGYQGPESELLEGITAGKPEDRKIHILAIHGAEPAPIQWGERRRFEVDVDWVPPNTEIFCEWYVEGKDGEWPARFDALPPKITPLDPTGALELDEKMWMGGQHAWHPVSYQLLAGEITQISVAAKLRVGRATGYEDEKKTKAIPVSIGVPKTLTILANGVTFPAAAPAALPAVSPTGTPAPPATPAPAAEGEALAGAALEFRTSWVAPPVRAGEPWTGYVTEWQVEPPPPASALPPVFNDPFRALNVKADQPGRHVVRVRIRPGEPGRLGSVQTRKPVLEASLAFRVVSSEDLASKGLAAVKVQGVPDYATTMRDLDKQIADIDKSRSHGSPAMWQLDAQREALGKMRERIRGQLGAAPTPLPAKGPLQDGIVYVTPVPAVMAVPEARAAIPLRTFLRISRESDLRPWRAAIVDATTQDVVAPEGTGWTEADAVTSALSEWKDRNEYPQRGTVKYDFTFLGAQHAGGFTTSATRKTFWEWFDRIVFGLQVLVATLLLVIPEPTMLTKAAGIALLTVGVLRGVYRLYESLSLGRPLLDERHVLEAISILLSFVGVSGGSTMARAGATALRGEALSARALTQFQLGRGMVLTAAAGDVGTFVWVAHSALAQMRAVAADTSVPEAERARRLELMTMQLASQMLLLIGTQAQLFRPGALTAQGTRAPAFVDKLGALQLDPIMRSRIEASLRRFGATDDLSALEPRALVERYLELQSARAAVGEDIGAAGGTRGRGVYEPAAVGTQTAASVGRAAAPLAKAFKGEGMRLENVKATDAGVTALLVVEVPASGTTKAQTLSVPVEIEVVPTLDGGGGAHGAESGMARMTLAGDHASGFRLRVSVDSRLATDGDVRANLGHELREGADLVRRLTHEPTLDVAAQQRAGVFEPGTSTEVTSHARAAAYELQDLVAETRAAIASYDKARASAAAKRGAPIPDDVRRAGEAAYRRLDAMLDAMGFADPATRAAKRSALLSALGIDEKSPVAAYVDRYADRATARVQRQAAVSALDPAARTGLTGGLGPDLEAHLMQRAPAAAVAPLAEAMGRNDAGNTIRGFLREALRQHRAGRLTDGALVDVAQRLAHLTRNYRDQLLDKATAAEVTRALQSEGPNTVGALSRIETGLVKAGRAGAAPATAATRFVPENELVGNGVHGIGWSEADARQRSVNQQAEDLKAGRTPTAPYDQGKFGSLADVWYAVQCAAQHLGPPGNAAGLPSEGVFQLPAGHGNVVYRPGQATPVTPDVVYVKVFPDGTVHAYPAVRGVINLGAVGGVVRPVVTY